MSLNHKVSITLRETTQGELIKALNLECVLYVKVGSVQWNVEKIGENIFFNDHLYGIAENIDLLTSYLIEAGYQVNCTLSHLIDAAAIKDQNFYKNNFSRMIHGIIDLHQEIAVLLQKDGTWQSGYGLKITKNMVEILINNHLSLASSAKVYLQKYLYLGRNIYRDAV